MLTMQDASGMWQQLQHLECHEAEQALGLNLAPNGNMELESWKEQAEKWQHRWLDKNQCSHDMVQPPDSTPHQD